MLLRSCLASAALMLCCAASAGAAEAVPGEIVVGYKNSSRQASHIVQVPSGQNASQVIEHLKQNPGVAYAAPNLKAHAAWVPNDPGFASQWNFNPTVGVGAAAAWDRLISVGRPGGQGVKIAVIDSGVAYRDSGKYRRSPDFAGTIFSDPWDFITDTSQPLDRNGHGTHVAGTIAEAANNRLSMTGLAWGATIMPIRVLDKDGNGDAAAIELGIRWAADHGAKVINLSIEFDLTTTAAMIPGILQAIDYAYGRGSLVVAASGNYGAGKIAYPAAYPKVLAVGATTDHQCLASYSDRGAGLDLVAPGGGPDLAIRGDSKCRPKPSQRGIVQVGLDSDDLGRMYLPYRFVLQSANGTSMAAPHVSATAALVIASGVLGANPTPAAVSQRLVHTARPLGSTFHYGAGIVDANRATNPSIR